MRKAETASRHTAYHAATAAPHAGVDLQVAAPPDRTPPYSAVNIADGAKGRTVAKTSAAEGNAAKCIATETTNNTCAT